MPNLHSDYIISVLNETDEKAHLSLPDTVFSADFATVSGIVLRSYSLLGLLFISEGRFLSIGELSDLGLILLREASGSHGIILLLYAAVGCIRCGSLL